LISEGVTLMSQVAGSEIKADEWAWRLSFAVVAAQMYPEARAALLERGVAKEKVDAMPRLQVVIIHSVHAYHTLRDKMLVYLAQPYPQAVVELDRVERS